MRPISYTWTKAIKILILLTLAITVFSGCSAIEQIAGYNMDYLYEEKEAIEDNTIYLPESDYVKDNIEMVMLNPETLNPLEPNEYNVDQVLKLIFEPVFKLDSNYQLVEGVIESYTKSSEKVYRFYLKSKSFHNETPLTSDDILFSYNYIKSLESSPYAYCLDYIESISVLNETTFDVRFKELSYYNLYALTFPIISKEYTDSDDYDAMIPVGSGPYKYSDYQEMMYLKLDRNTSFTPLPNAAKINVNIVRTFKDEYNMFLAKRIDVHSPLKTDWSMYSDDQSIQEFDYNSPYYYYIGINHTDERLMNEDYRKLIASNIPYTSIEKEGFLGHLNQITLPIQPTNSLVMGMDSYYSSNYYASYYKKNYDKSVSPTYMSNLRDTYPMFEIEPSVFTIIYNSEDNYQVIIANQLEMNFSMFQIRLNIVGLDGSSYENALVNEDYDMFIGSLKTGVIPDLEGFYSTGGTMNYGGYSSLNLDGLMNSYYKVILPEQFYKQLENLAKVVTDDLPIIPLGFLENGLFMHDQLSGDVRPSDFNQFYEFEKIELE